MHKIPSLHLSASFRVIHFGLHDATAIFQWLMNNVIQSLNNVAASHLDVIVIYSKTCGKTPPAHLSGTTNTTECGIIMNVWKYHLGIVQLVYFSLNI